MCLCNNLINQSQPITIVRNRHFFVEHAEVVLSKEHLQWAAVYNIYKNK
jgi:hypothetical protein